MDRTPHSEQRHPVRPDQALSREEINRLPLAAYRGPIHVVRARPQMLAAIRELRREPLLGFDTEKRPSFTKGESHPPALLQLAGRQDVYIFQLHILGLPSELTDLLANGHIIKAGVAIGRDLQELRQMTEFEPRGVVDIGACAMKSGMKHHGLRGLAAVLLGCRISKGAQLTNWERPDLPGPALQYAATDAWVSRRIYEAMKEHGRLGAPSRTAGRPAARNWRGLWHRVSTAVGRILPNSRRTATRG